MFLGSIAVAERGRMQDLQHNLIRSFSQRLEAGLDGPSELFRAEGEGSDCASQ